MTNKKSLRIKETCLVISNYKVCWDTNSKLAFISNNIPDYLDAEWLKTIDHVVLDGPWESQEYRRKGREFVVERVDYYRKELFPILNSALGLKYSEKTWGILLDSWLLHFLSVVYDRLNKLENAKEKLGNIFIKCPGEHPVSISTTMNFSGCCTKVATSSCHIFICSMLVEGAKSRRCKCRARAGRTRSAGCPSRRASDRLGPRAFRTRWEWSPQAHYDENRPTSKASGRPTRG